MTREKSDAERLVDHYDAAVPRMEAHWQNLINKGYQARMNNEPRMYHGRSRGPFFRGWDQADRELGGKKKS